ncbi:HTH domain-containing protein [candidate division NPL-UPA2 bacterium]|nr:HTH domain-containing protein [candidate division NPL-UPA2 bacterium]
METKFLEGDYLKAQKRHLLMERLFTLKMMFINNKELSVKEAANELGVSKRTIERDINKLYQIMDFAFSYDKKEKRYKHSDDISEKDRVEIYDFPELYKRERPQISMHKKDKEKKIGRYTWIINYLLEKKKLFAKRYLDEKDPGVSLRTLQRDLKELMLLYPCIKYDSVNKYYYVDNRLMPCEWKIKLVGISEKK